jgi:ketosteroid isomerase-like protein
LKRVHLDGSWLRRWLAVAALLMLPCAYADEYADASELMRAGKLSEALTKVDQFLATQPKDPQMRFLKGVIQRDTGKTQEAIATFTRLTEDYPELPEPYNNLAVLYAGQNQLDRARTALEMAIRTNPSYSTAHENLGDVYARLASQAYSRALQVENAASASAAPKLDLIRELFSVGANRGQRPSMPSAAAPALSGAQSSAGKPPPTLPAPRLPAAKAATATAAVNLNTANPLPAGSATASAAMPSPAPAPMATAPATTTTAAPPVAVSPGTESPSAAPDSASTANDENEVTATVRAWAAAWAAKDVKTYLAFYGKSFDAPGSLSRAAWEKERRQRITSKATISVKLDNLSVRTNGNQATVKFRQDYRANGLAVSSRKTLELQKGGGRWYIVKESVGG